MEKHIIWCLFHQQMVIPFKLMMTLMVSASNVGNDLLNKTTGSSGTFELFNYVRQSSWNNIIYYGQK